jgi:hypothetical protein
MKQVKILWMAVLTVFITACSDDKNSEEAAGDKNEEVEIVDNNDTYIGTLVVNQNDGTFYTQENVNVVVSIDIDAEILMKQVAFSEKMPVKLDMTIPKVSVTPISDGLLLTGTDIIPLAGVMEYPARIITDLTGELTTQSLSFEMKCGVYPLSFSGVKGSDKFN